MMKGIRRNQKGTVLLTVLCFTTMCMVIAAIALRISNQANKESTDNVMKSQAQITAEHYLEQYLSTFPTVTGSDGVARYNYDDLKKVAGANEENPGVITISVTQSNNLSGVNVSNAALTDTAAFGGNCTIYVYKQGSGIVVKSMGQYSDQTGLASAYFYGETPSASLNKNAIETCGSYNVLDTSCVTGDILLSYVNPNTTVLFKNNNGIYECNFKTNGNLYHNNEPVRFSDTLQGNAPTITTEGYMYFFQMNITTNVGKTDANGKHYSDTGYDKNNLLNKNGYLNSDKKIFLACIKSGNKIGSANKPIDIYSRGLVIGKIPGNAYTTAYTAPAIAKFKQDIEGMFQSTDENAANPELHGNIYCYKRAGGTIADDGDLIVNTMNSQTIDGDIVVDGNIYVLGAELKVTGNVYCTGTVTGTIKDTAGNVKAVSKTLPSDTRSIQPPMNYAPGLYVYGVEDNPTIYSPQNYKSQNPYKMFQQNDEKSKHFKDNFLYALDYTLATPGVATGYANDDNLANKEITINKSCRLNPVQIGVGNYGANDGAKYTVNVVDKDIWILLPATPGATPTKNQANFVSARFRVNNPKNGHHCYFVFYNYDKSLDVDVDDNGTMKNYYSTDVGKEDASLYYERQTGGFAAYGTTKFVFNPNLHGEAAVFTSDFATWGDKTPTNQQADTNIVFLIPDDMDFSLGNGDWFAKYQAVFYGPYADLHLRCNQGNQIFGQVKVNNYYTDGASGNDQSAYFCDLSDASILHSFLTSGAAGAGTLNLQYYIRHK